MSTRTTTTRRKPAGSRAKAQARAELRARARRLADEPIDYIDHVSFHAPEAEAEILGAAPEPIAAVRLPKPPEGLPPYLASLYQYPLLTREQEQHYFRKMNFLKCRADRLREGLNASRPRRQLVEQIEQDLAASGSIKNLLIRRNLRLVVSIARRFLRGGDNFFEMVSDGNLSLMRAIEKFDFSRGFKFSTYATWAIQRNFARSIPAEHAQLSRFRTGHDEFFSQRHHEGSSQYEQEQVNRGQREVLRNLLRKLDRREREIIATRYGLEEGTEPQTLEQVGTQFGVTKERIRQLEARALRKLRELAARGRIDIPGV